MDNRLPGRMLIMLLIVGLFFGALFGLKAFGNKKMNEFFDNMQPPPVAVHAVEVRQLPWPNQLQAAGTLVAVNGVQVTVEAAGKVQALHFESGDAVKQGDLLLELDTATERADLANLEAQLKLAEIELTRQERLYKLDTIAKSTLDSAAAQADSARAQVGAQRARLAQKTIRAPFDGELGIRQVNLGEFVSAGQAVVSLQALNPVYVDFSVPEQQLSRVAVGQQVELGSAAWPERQFVGQVAAIAPQVDTATRNFSVRAQVDNADGALRPGGFVDVALQLGPAREVLAVPRTAVAFTSYGNTVFVIGGDGEQKSVTSRFVKTGESVGDFVEILDGLKAGEKLASTGLFQLRSGSAVIVDDARQPEPKLAPAVSNGA